jgi:beta-lactamase class A
MFAKLNTKFIIVTAALASVAFFVGRLTVSKQKNNTTLSQNNIATVASNTSLTSPLLSCIDPKVVDMRELKSFKKEIDQYITNALQKSSDLHISFYFRDLNNGITIGVNEKELFSPASLMKVPVMITVLKAAEQKSDLLSTRIQYVKSNFKNVDEESGFEKIDQQYYTVEEYLKHMIVYSDNASTLLLAKFIGIDNVLHTEEDLNLNHAKDANSNTNFVSVQRYAAVFRVLYNASYLSKAMSEKALQLLTQANYKGGIRAAIPAQYNVANKYGERDVFDEKGKRNTLQLHHFGIVYYTGKPYILGIMTRGSTRENKEQIIKDLSEIAFKAVDAQMKKNDKVVFSE